MYKNNNDRRIVSKIESIIDSKYWYMLQFVFFFLLTFVIYSKYISNNILALSGDGCGYLNIECYERDCAQNGIIPLWNRYMTAGRPFLADLTNFYFYPLRILLSFLPIKWFFYSFYSFHLAFGATSFGLYLKEIKCDKWISILMCFVYYFSICVGGYRKSHLLLIVCTVYLPSILLLIEKYFSTGKAKFLYISSLLLAFQFFGGFPQYAFYTDIISGIYLFVMGVKHKWRPLKWICDTCIWIGLYIGITLVQLLPFAELYAAYSGYGGTKITLEQFMTYSVHPIKLLLMLCPTIFSDHPNSALMQLGYSEIQAELFLGTITLSLIILSVLKYRNEFRIRFFLGGMAATFAYAMCGTSEFLAKIFYKIPILGSFRCASRILFAFSFFGIALAACSLTFLVQNNHYMEFVRILSIEFITLLVIMVAAVNTTQFENVPNVLHRYIKTLFILVFAAIVITASQNMNQLRKACIILLCVGLIVVDTAPYWKEASTYSMEEFGVDNDIEAFLVDHKSEGKVLLASPYIDGNYDSAISKSFALSLGIQGINSYTALNDPRLSKLFTSQSIINPSSNFSGLYTGFPEISRNLSEDNDLISMLGVKYIIDQENVVPQGELYGEVIKVDGICVYEPLVTVPPSEEVNVIGFPVSINSDTNYRVSFKCSTFGGKLYIDLYGDGYDNPGQQFNVQLDENVSYYECTFNSGFIPEDIGDIYIRIVSNDALGTLQLNDFMVEQVECEIEQNPYRLVKESDGIRIFENLNCKSILYVPEFVENVSSYDVIYGNIDEYNLDGISYIAGVAPFKTEETDISNVRFGINEIEAEIDSDGDTFVNFSQASNSGWIATIDGKRTDIHEVNGYIQGIKVEKGKHIIKFIYMPLALLIGGVLTLISVCLWGYLVFIKKD